MWTEGGAKELEDVSNLLYSSIEATHRSRYAKIETPLELRPEEDPEVKQAEKWMTYNSFLQKRRDFVPDFEVIYADTQLKPTQMQYKPQQMKFQPTDLQFDQGQDPDIEKKFSDSQDTISDLRISHLESRQNVIPTKSQIKEKCK